MTSLRVLLVIAFLSIAAVFLQNRPLPQAVLSKNELVSLADTCRGENSNKSCWDDLFRRTLKDSGIGGAFDLLEIAYGNEGGVSDGTCHDLTHFLGREAYKLFARGRDFPVSAKTAYCNYGFFHGVTEAMTAAKKPLSDAQTFCRYIDEKISKEAPEALLQCYHGIGHGTVNNHDQRTWGNEQAMLAPALSICDEIGKIREERWRCASGAFHGLGSFYREHLYNLTVNAADPFWICSIQKADEYRETCFRELSAILGMVVASGDFLQMARVIDTIKDDGYATETMIAWGVPYKESVSYRPIGIDFCRRVPLRLRIACVKSIARQMIQAGKPGDELADVINYCQSQGFTLSETKGCFDFVLYWNGRWNVREKAMSVCTIVNTTYRGLCYEKIQKNNSN